MAIKYFLPSCTLTNRLYKLGCYETYLGEIVDKVQLHLFLKANILTISSYIICFSSCLTIKLYVNFLYSFIILFGINDFKISSTILVLIILFELVFVTIIFFNS